MIAWERSRAASGHGIIWGDADRDKQEEFSAECHSVDCFNRTTDSNKIEVIVLDDQKSGELRRIRTTGLAVYLDDCTILLRNRKKRHHTRLGSSAVLIIAFERE